MVAGGLLGGATSEGGGAVAFPVMTLALGLHPDVARDFLFVTQSAGWVQVARLFLFMKMPEMNCFLNVYLVVFQYLYVNAFKYEMKWISIQILLFLVYHRIRVPGWLVRSLGPW